MEAAAIILVGDQLTRWPALSNPDLVVSWALCEPHGGPLVSCGIPHGMARSS